MSAAAYYRNGKRGSLDGAPIWRPKWYGELGNDAEFREATKPRTAFKAAYYEGAHRMVIDGVPIRLAAHVKKWKAANRAALCQGSDLFGLVPSAPKHPKNRRYWYGDDLEASRQMAGDLFNHGQEHQEKVAAHLIGKALSRTHYVDLGGGKWESMPMILFEDSAAQAIAWALHIWGFYYREQDRRAA